jgi:hypothetical protein
VIESTQLLLVELIYLTLDDLSMVLRIKLLSESLPGIAVLANWGIKESAF